MPWLADRDPSYLVLVSRAAARKLGAHAKAGEA
jgi:hypothetical protein